MTKPDFLSFFLITILLLIISTSSIFSQTNFECSDKLNSARDKFSNKEFQAAIDILNSCLVNDQLGLIVLRIEALELLGQSYLEINNIPKAKEAITEVYHIWPYYDPDYPFGTSLSQDFRTLIFKVLKEINDDLKPRPKRKEMVIVILFALAGLALSFAGN